MIAPVRALPAALLLVVAACGGSSSDSKTPDTRVDAPPAMTSATPLASAAPTSSAVAATPPKPDFEDPSESAVHIALQVVMDRKTPRSRFPRATTSDVKCWHEVALSGDHRKDFAQLIEKCGSPTGLLEYVKPAEGRLHHKHDPRDTFTIKLVAGYCYRYFAVGDGTTEDMDILVKHMNGALMADDNTKSPAAIIRNEQPWCIDEDMEIQLDVAVDGPGHGGYTIGVWARPK